MGFDSVARAVSWGFMLVAAALALGRWLETVSLIHPTRVHEAAPAEFGLNPRDVFIDTGRGKIHGWYFGTDPKNPTLFYIHGNADTIAKRLSPIKGYVALGLNVFIYDPHGFGGSDGAVNRFNFVSDAFAAYRHLRDDMRIKPRNIFVLGQSLGAVPALRLANAEETGGLILECAFSTLRNMAADYYPGVPLWLLAAADYDNERQVRDLKVPVLLINGADDRTTAAYHSRRLFEMAPEPREYVLIERAGHTDMDDVAPDIYFGAIGKFIRQSSARQSS